MRARWFVLIALLLVPFLVSLPHAAADYCLDSSSSLYCKNVSSADVCQPQAPLDRAAACTEQGCCCFTKPVPGERLDCPEVFTPGSSNECGTVCAAPVVPTPPASCQYYSDLFSWAVQSDPALLTAALGETDQLCPDHVQYYTANEEVLVRQRFWELKFLAQTDPAAFAAVKNMPDELNAKYPKYIRHHFNENNMLMMADPTSGEVYMINASDPDATTYTVYFTDAPTQTTGSASVEGVSIGNIVVTSSGAVSFESVPPPPTPTGSTADWLVVVIEMNGIGPDFSEEHITNATNQQVHDLLFSTAPGSVRANLRAMSNGRYDMDGHVVRLKWSDQSTGQSFISIVARASLGLGTQLLGKHNVVFVWNKKFTEGTSFPGAMGPGIVPLPWTDGIATIGVQTTRIVLLTDVTNGTLTHEFLHSVAHIGHADQLRCVSPSGQPVPYSETCQSQEYGNLYDIMGWDYYPYLSDAFRYGVGWLTDQKVRFGGAGTYTLTRTSSAGPTDTELLMLDADKDPTVFQGANNVYLAVEVPEGHFLNNETDPVVTPGTRQPLTGVEVQLVDYHAPSILLPLGFRYEPGGFHTFQLPVGPEYLNKIAPSVLLEQGETFDDPFNGWRIRVTDVTADTVTVKVTRIPTRAPVTTHRDPIYDVDLRDLRMLDDPRSTSTDIPSGSSLPPVWMSAATSSYVSEPGGATFTEPGQYLDLYGSYARSRFATSKQFTIETWVYVPDGYVPDTKGQGVLDVAYQSFLIGPSGYFRFAGTFSPSDPYDTIKIVPVYTLGKATPGWHELVASFAPGHLRLYLDGQLRKEASSAHTVGSVVADLPVIGKIGLPGNGPLASPSAYRWEHEDNAMKEDILVGQRWEQNVLEQNYYQGSTNAPIHSFNGTVRSVTVWDRSLDATAIDQRYSTISASLPTSPIEPRPTPTMDPISLSKRVVAPGEPFRMSLPFDESTMMVSRGEICTGEDDLAGKRFPLSTNYTLSFKDQPLGTKTLSVECRNSAGSASESATIDLVQCTGSAYCPVGQVCDLQSGSPTEYSCVNGRLDTTNGPVFERFGVTDTSGNPLPTYQGMPRFDLIQSFLIDYYVSGADSCIGRGELANAGVYFQTPMPSTRYTLTADPGPPYGVFPLTVECTNAQGSTTKSVDVYHVQCGLPDAHTCQSPQVCMNYVCADPGATTIASFNVTPQVVRGGTITFNASTTTPPCTGGKLLAGYTSPATSRFEDTITAPTAVGAYEANITCGPETQTRSVEVVECLDDSQCTGTAICLNGRCGSGAPPALSNLAIRTADDSQVRPWLSASNMKWVGYSNYEPLSTSNDFRIAFDAQNLVPGRDTCVGSDGLANVGALDFTTGHNSIRTRFTSAPSPSENRKVSVTCTNPFGSTTKSIRVGLRQCNSNSDCPAGYACAFDSGHGPARCDVVSPPSIDTFSLSRTSAETGQEFGLTYSVSNASSYYGASCSLSGDIMRDVPLPSGLSGVSFSFDATDAMGGHDVTLTCTNGAGTVSETRTINHVEPPPPPPISQTWMINTKCRDPPGQSKWCIGYLWVLNSQGFVVFHNDPTQSGATIFQCSDVPVGDYTVVFMRGGNGYEQIPVTVTTASLATQTYYNKDLAAYPPPPPLISAPVDQQIVCN